MAKVKVGDRMITKQEEKKEAVWDFYNSLFGHAQQRGLTLDLQNFHRPIADLSDLDQIITEEVWRAIIAMPSDKAPGPDGYTGRFYKAAWQVIKADFMAAISRLLQGDVTRLYLLNSVYITLLPKKTEAIEVKDYRPISLVHSFAKIVTKILANQLAPKLSNLVSANQSAFTTISCWSKEQLGHFITSKRQGCCLSLTLLRPSIRFRDLFYWKSCNTWGLDRSGVWFSLNCFAPPPLECW
jgi:hypothetical protein